MDGAQDDDDVVIHQRVIVQCVGEHAHARARMVDEMRRCMGVCASTRARGCDGGGVGRARGARR